MLVIKKLSNNEVGMYLIYRLDLKFNRKDTTNIKIYKLNVYQNIDNLDNTIIDGKYIQKKMKNYF